MTAKVDECIQLLESRVKVKGYLQLDSEQSDLLIRLLKDMQVQIKQQDKVILELRELLKPIWPEGQ